MHARERYLIFQHIANLIPNPLLPDLFVPIRFVSDPFVLDPLVPFFEMSLRAERSRRSEAIPKIKPLDTQVEITILSLRL